MPTEHRQQIGEGCDACSMALATGRDDPAFAARFGSVATLVVRTGACWVQAYPTADQLHALAVACIDAAAALGSRDQALRLDALAQQLESA